MASAATARQRHAARARTARPAERPHRRVSGPVVRPRAVPAPKPVTGVFERIRALPDHRVVDRLLRGRVWICFVGAALMGIVAMQVSLLKLNSGISRAVETTATLERQNAGLEASIARLASGERIRAAADKRGMVTPLAGAVHYVRVRPGTDARRAARRMRPPSEAARELMANGGRVPGALMAPAIPGAAAPAAGTVAGTAPATTAPTTTAAAPPAGTAPGSTAGTPPGSTAGTPPGSTAGTAPAGTAPASGTAPAAGPTPGTTAATQTDPATGGTTPAAAPVG